MGSIGRWISLRCHKVTFSWLYGLPFFIFIFLVCLFFLSTVTKRSSLQWYGLSKGSPVAFIWIFWCSLVSYHLEKFVVSPAGNWPIAARSRFTSGLRGGSRFPTRRSWISWKPGSCSARVRVSFSAMAHLPCVCIGWSDVHTGWQAGSKERQLVHWPEFRRAESW